MAERTLPGIGLTGQWVRGADYKDGMEVNLLLLSVLTQCTVADSVAAAPGTPTQGDIYRATAAWGGGAAKDIMTYDGGAWTAITPQAGWLIYDATAATYLTFNGTDWAAFETGSMTGTEIEAVLDAYYGSTDWRTGGGGSMTGSEIETVLDTYYGSTIWRGDAVAGGPSVGTHALTVSNPDFETGDLTGWSNVGTAPVVEAASGGTGSWSGEFASPGVYVLAGGVTASADAYQEIDISAYAGSNTVYEVTFDLAQNDAGTADAAEVVIETRTSGGTVINSASYSASSPIVTNQTLEVAASADDAVLRITINFTRGGSGTYINAAVDNFSAQAVVSAPVTGIVMSEETASFSVTEEHLAGLRYVNVNSGSAVTVTVPPDLAGAQPCSFEAKGAGAITFAAGAGVTINSLGGDLSSAGQFAVLTLVPQGSNVYTLTGPLA